MGKHAFFRGQLEHTNELLVLLGEDTFVWRTASQTGEIIDRRLNCASVVGVAVAGRG